MIIILLISGIISCDDMQDKPHVVDFEINEPVKMFVLSEGLFNMNNSTLAFYDLQNKIKQSDYFQLNNKRGLGDTANDLGKYGSKLYVVVNVSGIIEVIDLKTAKTVSQIRLVNDEGKNREPRYIDFLEGKAYVCSFDGTVSRIDTSTLNIERTIRVGKNPDGICHANGKIYVSNSGGLNFPAYDNSVSVIDVRSFAVLHTLEVGTNPYHLEADDEGDVYVVVRGNYSNDSSRLVKIDGKDETIITFGNVAATDLVILNDTAYIYHFDNSTNQFSIKTFDCKSDKIITDNFITDNTLPSTPNGLDINPANGDIYLTDAKTYTVLGDVLCYNNQGKLKFRLQEAGLNPRKVIFL